MIGAHSYATYASFAHSFTHSVSHSFPKDVSECLSHSISLLQPTSAEHVTNDRFLNNIKSLNQITAQVSSRAHVFMFVLLENFPHRFCPVLVLSGGTDWGILYRWPITISCSFGLLSLESLTQRAEDGTVFTLSGLFIMDRREDRRLGERESNEYGKEDFRI